MTANTVSSANQFPYSVLIVGLAREGAALTHFLAERGANIVVTDSKSSDALSSAMNSLSSLPIVYALGGHPESLLDGKDIVFVSPGVPLEIPLLVEARRRGLPISTEPRLFTRLCPAPIVGITGSSGKTTTTAMVGAIFAASGRRTWVGGNIGQPLIGFLSEIEPDNAVVMELSSFQLDLFGPWIQGNADHVLFAPDGWSPPIAAVLNVTPNHLDRHPSMEAYIAAKAQILNHQEPDDVSVLNMDNAVTREMGRAAEEKRQVLWFSLEREVRGAFLHGEELVLRLPDSEETVCRTGELHIPGRHNVANALAACALAAAAGAPIEAMRQALTSFQGVEHRLELVRDKDGVRWFNDSIATAPERTVAAIRSFDQPIVLLAGGRDKKLPWKEMAVLTWQRVRHLVLFGEAAELIESAMRGAATEQGITDIHQAGTLEHAVKLASRLAAAGDVVLLSPGCTSFDAYPNFTVRGEHFRQIVRDLG